MGLAHQSPKRQRGVNIRASSASARTTPTTDSRSRAFVCRATTARSPVFHARCLDLSLALQALMRLPQREGATGPGTTESAQRPHSATLRFERPLSQPQPPKAVTQPLAPGEAQRNPGNRMPTSAPEPSKRVTDTRAQTARSYPRLLHHAMYAGACASPRWGLNMHSVVNPAFRCATCGATNCCGPSGPVCRSLRAFTAGPTLGPVACAPGSDWTGRRPTAPAAGTTLR